MEKKSETVPAKPLKETKIWQALITILILIAAMFYAVVLKGATPHVPLVIGCITAAVVSACIGYRWEDILQFMLDGITQSIEAILILLCIGMLVGVWIASGTVPTMIYYGLSILNARYFLVASALICGIVSFAIGAWGTLGTVGIALMGVGTALGVPLPLVAGSVVSGAYFGDAVSPLSDATNLSAAVVGRDVFSVVKVRVAAAGAAFAAALVIFLFVGFRFAGADDGQVSGALAPLLTGLRENFVISPLCLLPLAVIAGCVFVKVPAIPSMLCGVISGVLVAVFGQHVPGAELLSICTEGNISETGIKMLDDLLTAGGMTSMMDTISIIFIAMAFGGLMQRTGQMRALASPIIAGVHRFGSCNALTVSLCVLMNILLPDQYLGISVPGQMLEEAYDQRGYSRTALSTGLVGGAVSSPLVPWNTCGLYCFALLGVSASQYLRYSFFNLLAIVFLILFGFLRGTNNKQSGKYAVSSPYRCLSRKGQKSQ